VAEAYGPPAGLAAIEAIPPSPRAHAVRAELLARAGRYAEAVAAVDASLAGEATEPERRYRQARRDAWAATAAAS
jgi:RNA polymerase sigma-70 factor (ECF subfamily)